MENIVQTRKDIEGKQTHKERLVKQEIRAVFQNNAKINLILNSNKMQKF